MATHPSILAWRIPGTEEPDGLPSMGSHRVGHDWGDLAAAAAAWGTLALCLNVKLKCLCSAHREASWPCPPVNGYRKEKLTHLFLFAGQARKIMEDLWPFYFTSSSPPLFCSKKATGIPTLIKWHSKTLVCHLLRGLAFQESRHPLPGLHIVGLSWGKQSELGLSEQQYCWE